MSLEIKKLELQIAQVAVARMANEVKIQELLEAIDRISKDTEISRNKEEELKLLIEQKRKEE